MATQLSAKRLALLKEVVPTLSRLAILWNSADPGMVLRFEELKSAAGDLGVTLELDRVPCRETGMSAYEMMLSESQERMLMVLKPEKEQEAEAIFRKWGLDFAVVG